MGIFITGTDTNIGKTLIAAWICLHTRASYWKPVQTGTRDTDTITELANVPTFPEVYSFQDPLSPHAAAEKAGVMIDRNAFKKPDAHPLVIEGAGGVLVPLSPGFLMIDLIEKCGFPVLVVARSTLGTINHTCLTLEALRRRGIPILGVVLNGPPNTSNKQAIESYGRCPVIAEFPLLPIVNRDILSKIVPPITF